MSEKQHSQVEKFQNILLESSTNTPNTETDIEYFYSRLRSSFSPQEIAEFLPDAAERGIFPDEETSWEVLEAVYSKAREEIPFDEAHTRDVLIKELAPFYDRVGDIALHLSITFSAMEIAAALVRNIDFANDFANQMRSLIFDHVGNSQNSFWIIPVIAAVRIGEELITMNKIKIPDVLISKKVIKNLVEIGKILLPYIMISIMLGYQIDAETAQILPGSFGTPDASDIPVGLISIIGLAKVLEMQRYHRPFFRPIFNKLTMARKNVKAMIPLILMTALNEIVIPNIAKKWMSNSVLQETVPTHDSPISIVKSVFYKVFRKSSGLESRVEIPDGVESVGI